ncbi:MAG TPA: leucyl aminopeptidase [Thermoanaerobaculia bacterium]
MRLTLATRLPRGPAGLRRVAFLPETAEPWSDAVAGVRPALRAACRASGFRGREREVTTAGAWTLSGLGRPPVSIARLRKAVRRVLKDQLRHSREPFALVFAGVDAETLAALLPRLRLADYRFDRYKSQPKADAGEVRATLLPPAGVTPASLRAAGKTSAAVASAVAWACDLGNTPGHDLGPAELAAAARRLGADHELRVRVLEKKEIEKERMGGVLGVSAGSARPPAFVVAEYAPHGARGTAVLVGKGVTFDSGGISLKPAPSMGEMKYDMMGAATVLACVRAARELELPVHVVALAPLVENLPGGTATRPGDILRMRNGKTVEVDNTDAEGRLILGDALSYAEKFRPDVLLDFATLTGAVLVALGQECAGLMSADDDLANALLAAGETTGERLWRLPLWDEYKENLRSDWADFKNTGGRNAGTVNAAIFLKEFVPKGVAWAHIDFAGVAHLEKEHAGYDAGATGFGVALTIEFLKRRFG